jgi:hypothetical protein
MKNTLLLLMVSCLLVSSCATRKYGCGLTSVKQANISAPYSTCRGHGTVSIIEDDVCLIRIDGVLIKDDTTLIDAKYVLAYGRFNSVLKSYDGKIITFECLTLLPNRYYPSEMVVTVSGCIEERINYLDENGKIVFHKP